MEDSRFAILENFNLISKVMPYYGYNHKAFLLLSALSKNIRQLLIERYTEYRTFMFQYSREERVTIEDLAQLSQPSDLFRYSIHLNFNYTEIDHLKTLCDTVNQLIFTFTKLFVKRN